MKQQRHPIKFIESVLKYSPYEYKIRKYRVRKVRREELPRETDSLERFNTYGTGKKAEDRETGQSQNIALRRHLRKKELENKVRKNALGEEKTKEEMTVYRMEVQPVAEKKSDIVYTFDMVSWEKAMEKVKPLIDVESALLLDQDYDVIKWEEGIVYDDRMYSTSKLGTHLIIDANDKNLLFDIIEKEPSKEKKHKKKKILGGRVCTGKYNISGDKNYIETNKTLKSALGIQGVQHSIPALKLVPELYKTYLSKEELRFFHRPPLQLPALSEIKFVPLIENVSKPSSIFKKKRELTLTDTADFVLLEYSEEIPPLITIPGMASIITTFYRKSSSKDALPIEPECGGVAILDSKDPSPFMFIGDVQPGESISAVVNNLYKAPIFFHKTKDLIAIRTKEESQQYYLRTIDTIACVGQTLPMDEAYSPHSRKHNVFCKNRLKVAAYRLFYRKGNKHREIHIQQLEEMFPHFSEGSKRKWLKEYSECIKKGKENLWVLKPSASLLNEEDLRRIITPEQVCQYESMLAEERRLKDAGIVLAATEEEGGDDEELKLAVWNCTKNFVNATAGKGILDISGIGDPTGIGEGFSFLRTKKKEKEADEETEKKTTSEQLQEYKDEIKKVWDAQLASLRETKPHPKPKPEEILPTATTTKRIHQEIKTGKILSITRTFLTGTTKTQETEVVTDARIIDAYMKARKKQKREEARTSLKCGSCGQIGHMKTNKSCMNYKGKATEKKERKKTPKALLNETILNTVKDLFLVPFSIAFHRPVSLKKFPNYQEFVKHPIDLTSIKTKARNNEYKRYNEFLNDLKLMNNNCTIYNGAGHSLTKIASEMVEIGNAFYEKNKDVIDNLEKDQK
ncbi:transcription initiation factor TFIID subunit 1 [Nematocida sp. AWRm80]|nr:transcription initiation factor TFIID subunit 1 [Nematocida sp. AWRm80]